MYREPVSSRVIASLGYENDTETLEVEFHSGAVYRYRGVPEEEYERLIAAPSIGAYFNEHIRDAHQCERMT